MKKIHTSTRRTFIKAATGTTVAGMGLVGVTPNAASGFFHSVNDTLKIGLVGCGGRGTDAILNALRADSNSVVVALADAFQDRVDICYQNLSDNPLAAKRMDVPEERRFVGFDCCQQLVQTDVDVVLLAAPPYFRPDHMQAAIAAGKHVFCEKPVAVDPAGVREVRQACHLAVAKGLSVVSGLCYRYDVGVNAIMKRILDDRALGDIQVVQENYLTGTLSHHGRKPEWSPMEYQMRNWLYFNWLSGDHIVEQHIHSLDKAMWVMEGKPPVSAYGTGGRQVRTGDEFGNIYDHFTTVYEWPNGVKVFSHCRQMANCMTDTEDYVVGTKANARILRKVINDSSGVVWRFRESTPSMYDLEQQHLFGSIRQGAPINDGEFMCNSTLMAILGRECCYTGQKIMWDELANSQQRLGPATLRFGDYQPDGVPMPGGGDF